MEDLSRRTTFKDRNFLLMIFYSGPWERVSNFVIGVRPGSDKLRWEIPENPAGWKALASRIATWAEQRDALWRAKYAIRNRKPHRRWKRHSGD
jgi:hypothetical protein